MSLPADKKLFTIGEASVYLDVSADTLRRLESRGRITPKRGTNNERLYSLDDVLLIRGILKKAPSSQKTYSIKEAANLLNISAQTIRRWEKEGRIKTKRTQGRHRYFTYKDIQAIRDIKLQPKIDQKIHIPPREIIKVVGQPLPSTPQEVSALNLFNLKLISFVVVSSLLMFIANYSWEIGYMFNRLTGISIPGISEEELVSVPGEGDWLSILSAQKGVYEGDVGITGEVDITGSLDVSLLTTTKDLIVSNSASIYSLSVTSGLVISDNQIINSSGKIPALNGYYFENLSGENITNVDAHHLGGVAASSFLRSNQVDTAEATINFTASPGSTNVNGGPVYINPAASTSDYTLFGIALGGLQRFRVDAEGDVSIAGNIATDGALDVNGTGISDVLGTLNLSGNILSSTLDLTIDPAGGGVKIGTGTPGTIDLAGDDLYVTGDLEVDGTINPGFTAGSVVFQEASGLAEDNPNFFWDNTNKKLGIGTISPTEDLTFYKNSFDQPADMIWNQAFDEEISDFDTVSPTWDKEADFEEGDTTDFDSETDADGDLNENTTAAHDGTYGIRIDFDDTNLTYGRLDFGAIDQTSWNVNFWVYFGTNFVNSFADGEYMIIAYGKDGSSNFNHQIRVRRDTADSVMKWGAYVKLDNDAWSGNHTSGTISENTWYHVHYTGEQSTGVGNDDGWFKLYIDGGLLIDQSGKDNDTKDVDAFDFGMRYTTVTSPAGGMYMDNIRIDPTGAPYADKLAAQRGSYGLAVPVMNTTGKLGYLNDPTNETAITEECWIDPNTLAMGTNESFPFMIGKGTSNTFRVWLKWDGSNYKIGYDQYKDSGANTSSGSVITDGWHHIQATWAAATGAGNNDGYIYLYIDGVLVESETNTDNDTLDIDEVKFGAPEGLDAGTSGIFYMDDVSWSNQTGMSNYTTSSFGLDPSYLRFYEHADIKADGQLSINASQGVVFNSEGLDIDFRIEGDTEQNLFFVSAGNNRIGIGTASPDQKLHLSEGSLKISRTDNYGQIQLTRIDSTPTDADNLGMLRFYGPDSGGTNTSYGYILGRATDVTDGTEDFGFRFVQIYNGAVNTAFIFNSDGTGQADIAWTTFSPYLSYNFIPEEFSKEDFQSGDLVKLKPESNKEIDFINRENDSAVYGVVVPPEGFISIPKEIKQQLMDEENGDVEDFPVIPVAHLGTAVTKVYLKPGEEISTGDFVTSSSISKFAQKTTKAGTVLGKSMQEFNPTSMSCQDINNIDEAVWPEDNGTNNNKPCFKLPNGSHVGKIMVFVNVSWYDPGVYLTSNGDFQPASDDSTTEQEEEPFETEAYDINSRLTSLESELLLLKSSLLTDNIESVSNSTPDSENQSLASLSVLGSTVLGDTVINGRLDIGILSFDNLTGSIDAIGPLKLQSLALAPIEFVGGAIEMDQNGNLDIKKGVVKGNEKIREAAEILPDQTSISIQKEWETPPVSILVTPSYNTQGWVTDITNSGFTINVNEAPTIIEKLYWWAIW
jgi:excisionase family DNA binding protein